MDQKDIEFIRMLKGKNMDISSIATATKMSVEEIQQALVSIYSNIDPTMEIKFAVDTYNVMISDLSFLILQIQEKYKDKEGKTTDPISEKDIKLIMELNSKISKLHNEKIKLLESISNMSPHKQYDISSFETQKPALEPVTPIHKPIKRKIRPTELYDYIYKILNWIMLEQKSMQQFKKAIKKKKYYTKLYNASKAPNEETFNDAVLCIKQRKLPTPTGNVEKYLFKYWNEK